ncbi:hypothetical protein M0802_011831 [Mischocyttarus mexicanus]|nr:hypothetical protein M0802_011847 [Mischocyttarus mexicanus]KAI4487792.1 hypothetical protein M0802_011831 [Mischocyttarus mexicanus]
MKRASAEWPLEYHHTAKLITSSADKCELRHLVNIPQAIYPTRGYVLPSSICSGTGSRCCLDRSRSCRTLGFYMFYKTDRELSKL